MRFWTWMRGPSSPAQQVARAVYEAGLRGEAPGRSLEDLPPARPLLAASPQEQIDGVDALLRLLLERLEACATSDGVLRCSDVESHAHWALHSLATRILERSHPYTERDLGTWIGLCSSQPLFMPADGVLGAIERAFRATANERELGLALAKLMRDLERCPPSELALGLRKRVGQLLPGWRPTTPAVAPPPGAFDAWTFALRGELDALDAGARERWASLLAHASTARSTTPSRKWSAQAQACIDVVGGAEFARIASAALRAVGTRAPFPVKVSSSWTASGVHDGDPTLISEQSSDSLRGLIWMTAHLPEAQLESQLGDTAERCFKKLPGHGPLSIKAGNALLFVLSRSGTMRGVAELSRLRSRAKHASTRRLVDKARDEAAERMGMSLVDLEELAVPTLDLDVTGARSAQLGDFRAELRALSTQSIELSWYKPNGARQKAIPAAVKTQHAAELKELKRCAAELAKLLPAQRDRIERMLLSGRTLPFADWRARYLEHPLTGILTRRLIWRFGAEQDATLGAWSEGRLSTLEDDSLTPADATPVRLWHPIESSADTVGAWRSWLSERSVTQPFKQAHREIYRLTDAERTTGSYSNRFAAHLLRQHQVNELFRQRGWSYKLQGRFDSHNTPTLDLEPQGYSAEFWLEPIEDPGEDRGDPIYYHVSTDQVRFYRLREPGPLNLAQVPERIFTEVMRDVDLFVGVCSVGNDPTWQNGGREGRFQDYWRSYAFGELGESARTRREVLERLVPQLAIAERCSVEDRFLTVRGDLRTYRIHLGSGNIHMSPNDQYLCIVQARSRAEPGAVLLPFEGDGMLSLILSKAFLLAADREIRDPTIVAQIRRS